MSEDASDDIALRPRTIGRNGLATQAYEALREQILDQTIVPGARINIDQLAAELGVSSSPIREALARLLSERLVSFEPYIGYSAAPIPDDAWFHDMVDFRAMLEGNAAAIGAQRRDPETIAALEQAFAEMASSGLGQHYRKYRRFNAADAQFHTAIVASAENQVFRQVYADVQPHVHYARLYISRGVEEEADVAAQHLAILDAFRKGNGVAARDAVIVHLESVRTHLLEKFAHARAKIAGIGRPKKR
ncbi:GntR family transcriptional regulator [soil metagenome]